MLSGREVETFDPLMPSQLDRVYSLNHLKLGIERRVMIYT